MNNIFIENFNNIIDTNLIIGNNIIKEIIENIIEKKNMPNLLLCGENGSGKNFLLNILINNLFKEKKEELCLYLSINDERGISTVREKIKIFSNNKINNYENIPNYKVIIFDQADYITIDAQNALRRIIEKSSTLTRFIFLCSNIKNIIEPICSRFLVLNINSKNYNEKFIYYNKNLKLSNENKKKIKKIILKSKGDTRKEQKEIKEYLFLIKNRKYNRFNHVSEKTNSFNNLYKILKLKNSVKSLEEILLNISNDHDTKEYFLDFYKYLLNKNTLSINNKKIIIKNTFDYNYSISSGADIFITSISYLIKLNNILN